MPKYLVVKRCYLNEQGLKEIGEVIEYDGRPGSALQLIDGQEPTGPAPETITEDEAIYGSSEDDISEPPALIKNQGKKK